MNIMLFWVIAAALTLIACAAVLWPLTRRLEAVSPAGYDAEVYKDQLAEIDRDATRGLIASSQVELARAEVARRLIKAAAASKSADMPGTDGGWPRWVAVAAILAIPVIGWGMYSAVGAAGLPDEPLAARMERNPADNTVEELIARAERHLAANPDDASGWQVLGPIYLRQQRYADARKAYENAIRLLGSDAAREVGLGEAIAGEAGGVVTADARAAFERAAKHDPSEPRARYFLATALAQEGRLAEARDAWQAMKASLPADSPWQGVIDQALAEAATRMAAPEAGPSDDDVAAAETMSAGDRTAMIEGMVASLDAKLRDNPADLAGWQRLIRSYVVLGRKDAAADALARAVAGLASDPASVEAINRFAADLGIGKDG